MSETIVVALLAFAGTILGSITGILTANKMSNYRIEQLEKKVEKHNNTIERVYELEKKTDILKEDIIVISDYIAELKEYHK